MVSLAKFNRARMHNRQRFLISTTLAIGIVLVSTSTTASVASGAATKVPRRATASAATATATATATASAPAAATTSSKRIDALAAMVSPACVSQGNTTQSDAKVIEVGIDVHQHLCNSDQILWSSLYLQAGLTYTIGTRHLSVEGDTELSLYSPDGQLLLSRDNDGGAERGASRLIVTAATSATYLIAITRNPAAKPTGTLVYDLRAD
jgi:hypothetical protein